MARLWLLFVFAALVVFGPGQAWAQTATSIEFATLSPSTTQVPGKFCYSNGQDLVCDGTIPANAGLGVSDSIVSGTQAVTVNQSSGIVSLTTAGVDWGYLNPSNNSYLPKLLTTNMVVSATTGQIILNTSPTSNFFYGIGISNAASLSNARGSTYKPFVISYGNVETHLFQGSNAFFAVDPSSTGKIGIGTRSPSTTLHVIGTARITSDTDVRGQVSATNILAAAVQQCTATADVGKMYRHANGKWATCTLR